MSKKLILNLTFNEIKSLIRIKKKCPHCGNDQLEKEVLKQYEGRKRASSSRMNLMEEDVYRCIFIYNCPVCRQKYTLNGLNTGEVYGEPIAVSCQGKKKKIIDDNEIRESNKIKKIVRIFFYLCLCMQILIPLEIAVTEKQYVILLIAFPFTLIWYLVVRSILKK